MPLGTEVGLGPGDIVRWGVGTQLPHGKGAQQPTPTFRPTLLWHGRPSHQLLSCRSIKVFHGVTNHRGDIFVVLNPTTTRNVYVFFI